MPSADAVMLTVRCDTRWLRRSLAMLRVLLAVGVPRRLIAVLVPYLPRMVRVQVQRGS